MPWTCEGNKKLELFLSCPADEVLVGGAAGGAKTEGLIMSAIGDNDVNIFNNPNWKVLYLRRTFPELETSAILRSQQLFHDKMHYDAVKHRWTASGGGMLKFGTIKNEDELFKHHSAEWTRIIFDELTTFTERMYLYLFSRLRSRDALIRPKIRAGTNPGNLGHAWVKKRFIDGKKPYEIYHDKMKMPDGSISDWSQCFIPATVFDNKFLMKSDPLYVRRLMELPETEKQALLYGNWDIFSGQFFPEFCEDHLQDDFDIPKEWPIWVSMDWGYLTKCAVGLYTRDPDTGCVYLFKEIYVSKVPPPGVSDMIKSYLGDLFRNIQGRYTDTRVAVKDETNVSTQEKFGFEGLYFQIVNDDRVNGWHRCRELLLKDKEGNVHFKVFRSCVNFIRVISQMVHDPNRPEDLNKKSEAHLADMFRYFAVTRHATGTEKLSAPVDFSPTTGYIGSRGDDTLLRNRIPRLVGVDKSRIRFLDKPNR